MQPPRVYAVCESESVAETLAILVEPHGQFRWLDGLSGEPRQLPPPALLIDARSRPSSIDPRLPWWPGVRSLRLNVAASFSPTEAQFAIAGALRAAGGPDAIEQAVDTLVGGIALVLRPRLAAARCLVAMVERRDTSADPSWRELLRQQLDGIAVSAERVGIGGRW